MQSIPAATIEYTLPIKAEAYQESSLTVESIEDKINRIAGEYGIATTSLYNLAKCESKLKPMADNGFDRGLVQINREAWPEITDEQAFDPDFALNFAAKKIADGEGYIWTCGNCYSYALTQLGKLPKMKALTPNSDVPRVGGLVIMDYNGKKHVAVVIKVLEEGIQVKECNYIAYSCGERLIKWDDKHLIGYWHPSP